MDMLTNLVNLVTIVSCVQLASSQFYGNQIQLASKPAPDNYARLAEIPFENAVRAVSTPPRDYVPIYENQQDVPPNVQQMRNAFAQRFTNAMVPQQLVYNSALQIPQSPMRTQEQVMSNDYPNQRYNALYQSAQRPGGFLQGNLQQRVVPQQPTYQQRVVPQQPQIIYMPVPNNFQSILPQNFRFSPFQRPSFSFNNLNTIPNFQNRIPFSRTSSVPPLASGFSGNNIQYLQMRSVPKAMYRPSRISRMASLAKERSYYLPRSQYPRGFQYANFL